MLEKTILIVVIGTILTACSTIKTKDDCIVECKKRGAEYAGLISEARNMGWGVKEDACQCK